MPLFFLFFTVFTIFFIPSVRAAEPTEAPFTAKLTGKTPLDSSLSVNNYPHVLCQDEIETTHKLVRYVYGYEEYDRKKTPYLFALHADTGKLISKLAYKETPLDLFFSGHYLIIEYDYSLVHLNSLSFEIELIEYFSNPSINP